MTDDEKAHTCSDEKNFLAVGRAMSERYARDKADREKADTLLRAVRTLERYSDSAPHIRWQYSISAHDSKSGKHRQGILWDNEMDRGNCHFVGDRKMSGEDIIIALAARLDRRAKGAE